MFTNNQFLILLPNQSPSGCKKKHLSSSWFCACKYMCLRVWRLMPFVTAFCNSFRSVIFFSIWLYAPLSREVSRKTKSLCDQCERFSPSVKVYLIFKEYLHPNCCSSILSWRVWKHLGSVFMRRKTRQHPKCLWFLAQYFWSRRMLLIDSFLAYTLTELKCIKRKGKFFYFQNKKVGFYVSRL